MDDLAPEAAVSVLRGWGVVGHDLALEVAARSVGCHALSVSVIGSYLSFFAEGNVDAVEEFRLEEVTGEDPKAAKLARVLDYYTKRLPEEERDLLTRLSLFPSGATQELLAALVDAGGSIAGGLAKAKPRLSGLLQVLRGRGLVFKSGSGLAATWTAHPFLRERFRLMLNCPTEPVFQTVAEALSVGLVMRPNLSLRGGPTDVDVLDRIERLIEAKRLAGHEQEAFDLYWYQLGNHEHLGKTLGEYERGYRILAAFNETGQLEELGRSMILRQRSLLATELSFYAIQLGRLTEAREIRILDDEWMKSIEMPVERSKALQNSAHLALRSGRLRDARTIADEAVREAQKVIDPDIETEETVESGWTERRCALSLRAAASHALGDLEAARDDFFAAHAPNGSTYDAFRCRHSLDLGDAQSARAIAQRGLAMAARSQLDFADSLFHVLLARVALADGGDPVVHLEMIRNWTSRSGEMQSVVESHLLEARRLLDGADVQAALGEVKTGLIHAEACGFGILRIELLVLMSRVHLALPHASLAIQSARRALDLAVDRDCAYAWGEADAAQVWGEAYFSNSEFVLARRAFSRALSVRKRIEHPGIHETEEWLLRTPACSSE